MSKRQKAQAHCLAELDALCPGNPNVAIWKKRFDAMSDKEFYDFFKDCKDGVKSMAYIEPNLMKTKRLTTKSNLEWLKKRGVPVFQRVIETMDDGSRVTSNHFYPVVPLVVRRQAQHMVKKISIPKHNRTMDYITGQPAGNSRASAISYPEQGVIHALGLTKTAQEWSVYRGGDIKGFSAMNQEILERGTVRFDQIKERRSGVEVVHSLSVLLKGAHIGNTLNSGVANE